MVENELSIAPLGRETVVFSNFGAFLELEAGGGEIDLSRL